jgi:hypothetical protein
MAKALQCPTCGHRQRLDEVAADVATFRCSQCDRLLKVPSSVRPAAAPAARAADNGSATRSRGADATAPPPRAAQAAPAAPAAARTTSVAPGAPPRAAPTARPPGPPVAPSRSGDGTGAATATAVHDGPPPAERRREPVVVQGDLGVHWAIRALVWAASLGIGFVVVLLIARSAGYVTFDAATDVIADDGITRYRVPATFALGWALVSALLAHLGIEGLARWMRTRRMAAVEG